MNHYSRTAGREFHAGSEKPKRPSHRTTYRRKIVLAKTLWESDLKREVVLYGLQLMGMADAAGMILSKDLDAWIREQEGSR